METQQKKFYKALAFYALTALVLFPYFVNGALLYGVRQIAMSWSLIPDTDSKLKFVSGGVNGEVSGEAYEVMDGYTMPVEIKKLSVVGDGKIVILTNDKSVVKAPTDASVTAGQINGTRQVRLKYFMFSAVMYGFETVGVKTGQKLKAGEPIGTLWGDTLTIEIYKGDSLVPKQTLETYLKEWL